VHDSYPPLVGPGDRVVLFDGVCKLCGAWAQFLIRFDRKQEFRLASVQSPEGKAILEWFGLPTDNYESMLLVEGNKAYKQSTAFIRVMARLPLPWPSVAVVWLIPSFIRNWLYDRVALNRYAIFGKHEMCLLPAPDNERRFLNVRAGA
jgi:predicted DCC family thiol-disulfide oxidoreductase YuxK